MNLHLRLIVFFSLIFAGTYAQNLPLHGTVYDYFSKKPLDGVTVQTTSGKNAITDSLGKFLIPVTKQDSLWFSFLSKKTTMYPVDTIRDFSNFEIALYIDAAWLPAVKVKTRNYQLDSIENRQEYAKVFNFRKPGLKFTSASPSSYVPGSVTAGIDLDELINSFRFRRNRQMLSFQERLIQQEHDKYVNDRFTRYLVQKLTALTGTELDTFMSVAKPSYELLQSMNDLELGYYIQQMFKVYQNDVRTRGSSLMKNDE